MSWTVDKKKLAKYVQSGTFIAVNGTYDRFSACSERQYTQTTLTYSYTTNNNRYAPFPGLFLTTLLRYQKIIST